MVGAVIYIEKLVCRCVIALSGQGRTGKLDGFLKMFLCKNN